MSQQSFSYNVKNGSQVKTIDILDETADLKVTDDKGNTLLHISFKSEKPSQARIIQVFEILINRGLDINTKNAKGRTALHLAIKRRYRDVIDFCIRQKADLKIIDYNGNSLGHFIITEECRRFHLITKRACLVERENENSSFVDWMVTKEFDFFYKRNEKNQSALYLAIELNLQHILMALLNHVIDFPSIEKDQKPLLCYFLEMESQARSVVNCHDHKSPIHSKYYLARDSYNIVKTILEKSQSISNEVLNASLRLIFDNGHPINLLNLILHNIPSVQQLQLNDESLIKYFTNRFYTQVNFQGIEHAMKVLNALVDKGADVNEPYENGLTIALQLFLYYPKLTMLQRLQNCGTDFNIRTKYGESFLHLVSRHGNEFGMVKIAKEGCDINAPNSKDETPLKIAIICGKIFVALDLLNFGADVNDTKDGMSPLCLACIHGRTKVVEKLIELGADIKYKHVRNESLLHAAVNHQSTVELLIKHGADVNSKDSIGCTPLHHANRSDVIATLISSGAFVDSLDYQGNTPLFYAMIQSSIVIAELLKHGADIREPTVLQYALRCFRDSSSMADETSRYTMEHLVKMHAVDLMYKISHTDKNSERQLQAFFKKCKDEVKLLKDFFVDDCTSLYHLMHKNPNRRCGYIDNEKLVALVEDNAIAEKFPNYFVLIIGCYNEAKMRKLLLIQATCSFEKLVKVSLPDLCTDMIFIYLSNMDLVKLIKAGETL